MVEGNLGICVHIFLSLYNLFTRFDLFNVDPIKLLNYRTAMAAKQFSRWAMGIMLGLMLSAQSVCADGKVFYATAKTIATTPDQRALLHYSNGVERLVIETSFVGEGTNFAWVVPLPAVPQIEATSTNFFPAVMSVFRPKLIHENLFVLWMLLLFILGSFIWSSWLRIRGRSNWAAPLVAMVFCLFIFALLLPAFATAGIKSVQVDNQAVVIKQERVGLFDTVVLSGKDGQSVLAWLRTNGFHVPDTALPVVRQYAEAGWVFVGSKASRTVSSKARGDLHPLFFTFNTDKPVYPLKLTGIENPQCEIELFVFGPQRAEMEGFQVQYCGEPQFIKNASYPPQTNDQTRRDYVPFEYAWAGAYRYANAEVKKIAGPAAVVTLLKGRLSSKQMEKDGYVSWRPFEKVLPVKYSYPFAVYLALMWITGIGCIGTLIIMGWMKRVGRQSFPRLIRYVWIVALMAGVVQYWTLEKVGIDNDRRYRASTINEMNKFVRTLMIYEEDRQQEIASGKPPLPVSIEAFQSVYLDHWKRPLKNVFTQKDLRFGTTPGDVLLNETATSIEVIWHDRHYMPHVIATFAKAGEKK